MTRYNTENELLAAAAEALASLDTDALRKMSAQADGWLGDHTGLTLALEAMSEAAFEIKARN